MQNRDEAPNLAQIAAWRALWNRLFAHRQSDPQKLVHHAHLTGVSENEKDASGKQQSKASSSTYSEGSLHR